ncbi:MAG: cupin domain-containing protein [Fusobacterium sp.]|nr:cupin domain-containing protein [Fusobacterium sp.]
MFYNVLKVKDLVDLDGRELDEKVLMESQTGALKAVALKKEEILDTHTSTCDAAVLVVDGEIEIHFDAEKFELDKGEMIMFKKDAQHKVVAKKDSKFLIIKI